MSRRYEIDGLRGLMLILMTITHLPTVYAGPLGQPFGFVSAAEGFVFLSAYLVGGICTRVAERKGVAAMQSQLERRALKVYAAHAGLLIVLLLVLAPWATHTGNTGVTNWLSYAVREPALAPWAGAALLYNPPLFDILPMYVLFLAASPWILRLAFARGWAAPLAASVMLWLLAQVGAGPAIYDALATALQLPVPYEATGAFHWLAWQFPWVFGLFVGHRLAGREQPLFFPRPVLALAVTIVVVGFFWRHLVGQAPFGANVALNLWFDKWQLAPARLANFVALVIVVVQFGRLLKPLAQTAPLVRLGESALPVFCAHLVVCAFALTLRGHGHEASLGEDLLLLTGAFAVLYAVALVSSRIDAGTKRRAAPSKAGTPGEAVSARTA